MRRMITPLLFMFVSTSLYAQEPVKLVSRVVKNFSKEYYGYNEQNKLDSIYFEEGIFQKYALLKYDDNGNFVREDAFQLKDNEWTPTYYVEYTYNDKNQLLTRSNYNSLGTSEFTQSTRMEWTYDDNGRIATVRTCIPSWTTPGEFDVYTEDTYTYENLDKPATVETRSVHFMTMDPNDMWLSAITNYTYDEQGRQTEYLRTDYDEYNVGAVLAISKMTFSYDSNGNMTEYLSFTGENNEKIAAKYVYHYDLNYKNEDLCLPIYFEKEAMPYMMSMTNSTNMITMEEWWQMPTGSEELIHAGDYEYTYEGTTGIKAGHIPGVYETNFYVSDNKLFLTNTGEKATVRVFTANGTEVLHADYMTDGISLQSLPKGVYVAFVNDTKAIFKFMK